MGALTLYLQEEFERLCSEDRVSHREVRLLPAELGRLLGYAPRSDVPLKNKL